MILKETINEDHEILEIESSNIKSTIYYPTEEKLLVEFNRGGKYIYYPIIQYIYDMFKYAESQGKYFRKNIQYNKKIEFKKIEDSTLNG